MTKLENINDPNSCWNKAKDGERVFILLERDEATPNTIRDWANRRIRMGLNKADDPQIQSARQEALRMEMENLDASPAPTIRPE